MIPTVGYEVRREVIAIIEFVDWAIRKGDPEDRKIAAKMAGRWKSKDTVVSSYYRLLLDSCLADVASSHSAGAV